MQLGTIAAWHTACFHGAAVRVGAMKTTAPTIAFRVGYHLTGFEWDRPVTDVDTTTAGTLALRGKRVVPAVVVRVTAHNAAFEAVFAEPVGERRGVSEFDVTHVEIHARARERGDGAGLYIHVQLSGQTYHFRNSGRTVRLHATGTVRRRLARHVLTESNGRQTAEDRNRIAKRI